MSSMDLGTLRGKVSLDISPLEKGLGNAMARVKSWSEQLKAAGIEAGRKLGEGAAPEAEKSGRKAADGFEKGFDAGKLVRRIGGVLAGLGATALVSSMTKMGVSTAASLETAAIGFETMLGSAEKADSFIRDMQDFAAKTPFDFPGLQTAATSLVSIGIETDRVLPIMKTLGDVTSGMGTGAEGISRATRALQQMNAAQRVSGEDLNQLRDAGIPVYDLLSAALGKTKQEVAELASSGKLGKDALDAMMGALETGAGLERFSGLMDKQSQSLTGLVSTFQDTVQMGMAEAVAPLMPKLKEGLEWLSGFMESTVFPTVTAGFDWIVQAGSGIFDLFTKGEFTGGLREALGVEEDSLIVSALFAIRDAGIWAKDAVSGLWNLLIEGDFTAAFRDAFGVEEDSPLVDFLLNVREVVASLPERFQEVVDWVSSNKEWLEPLAVSILSMVAAWKLYKKVQEGVNGVMALAKGGMAALNVVMAANPIGLIALALVGLAAGLIYAYNHSEKFRDFVNGMWDRIKGAAETVSKWFTETLVPAFQGVWDSISGFFQAAIDKVVGAWDWLTEKFSAGMAWLDETFSPWGERIHAILVLPMNLAKTLIGGAWDWIKDKFSAVGEAIATWVSTKWAALKDTLSGPLETARLWIGDKWDAITGVFGRAWDTVKTWVSQKWDGLKNLLSGPIDTAKGWIEKAMQGVRDAFSAAVDFIKDVWDGIIDAVKKPIRFVLTTVIDNGLIAGFNKIADFAGSPRIAPITPAGFAGGGFTGNGGKWQEAGIVHRGEVVWSQEDIAAHGGVDAVETWRRSRPRGYADGGIVGTLGSFFSGPAAFFSGIVEKLVSGVQSSPILSLMLGIPTKVASMIAEWAKSKILPRPGGLPTDGTITSRYGYRNGPFLGYELHDGIDIGAPEGTPVRSVLPGIVDYAGWQGGYGNFVGVTSGEMRMFYAHMSSILASLGQAVAAGQTIGLVGSTGYSTGPHLHWGASINGVSTDPSRLGGGYANGTSAYGASRGWWRVGEQGPEWINFSGHEQVAPSRPGGGGPGMPEHVTLVAEDGTLLGVFKTVASSEIKKVLAPAGAGAIHSKFGGL